MTKSVMPAHSRSKNGVASLAYVAGIHVLSSDSKTWMAGTSPAMTARCASALRYPGGDEESSADGAKQNSGCAAHHPQMQVFIVMSPLPGVFNSTNPP
jgi:hypothetical protein